MANVYISTIKLPGDDTTYYVKDSEARTSIDGKITNPATKSNGNFLKFNGTEWVAAEIPDTGVLSVTAKNGDYIIDVTNTDPSNPVLAVNLATGENAGNVDLSRVENAGLKANIADAALTIAKTNGLQTALDAKEDESNKVTTLSASSTDTQYPSAKIVWTKIDEVSQIAAGKTKSYVIDAKTDITGTEDASGNFTNVTAITGVTLSDLKIGDVVLIKATDVPDYWVSQISPSVSLNKLETTKIDLDDYVSKAEAGDLAYKDSASGSYTPAGSVSTPTITVTPTTTTVNSITDVGTLPSFTQGDDEFTQGSYTQGAFSQGTLPTWSAAVNSEILSFTWSQGTLPTHANDTFVKPTFTQGDDDWSAGTLPTKGSNTTVATGIQSATSSQPTFTGTAATITVE